MLKNNILEKIGMDSEHFFNKMLDILNICIIFANALTKALHNSEATVVAHASERNWFGSSVG